MCAGLVGFNEAGAFSPGKRWNGVAPTHPPFCFNEAGAFSPGKPSRATSCQRN